MISRIAVAVTLPTLSVLDIWKLELGLAPYSITAAVGALTLEVKSSRNCGWDRVQCRIQMTKAAGSLKDHYILREDMEIK